jgi:hypothetical protein
MSNCRSKRKSIAASLPARRRTAQAGGKRYTDVRVGVRRSQSGGYNHFTTGS